MDVLHTLKYHYKKLISNLKSVITFKHKYHFTQCQQRFTTKIIYILMKNDIFEVKTITMKRKKITSDPKKSLFFKSHYKNIYRDKNHYEIKGFQKSHYKKSL